MVPKVPPAIIIQTGFKRVASMSPTAAAVTARLCQPVLLARAIA